MEYGIVLLKIIVFLKLLGIIPAQANDANICTYGSGDSGVLGVKSIAEQILEKTFRSSSCQRLPTMEERNRYYNPIKTGEVNETELLEDINGICAQGLESAINHRHPWSGRMDNMVYTWTVDFHPAPSACNIAIYKDIGVAIHPEIDHPPFCTFSGFCRNRLNKVFGLGGYMAGFALDPDHTALKRDFYNVYKDDPEFQRIDVFMCSHPLANCELFEHFKKPMIIFATTRYEFGRNDVEISWRVREISKWNAWGELAERQRNLTKFVHAYHKAGLLALTANSLYDAEYMFYFTGVRPVYIPSWCGDADSSYGQRPNWIGCQLQIDRLHQPSKDIAIIVPFKRHHTPTEMFEELEAAKSNFTKIFLREPLTIQHSAEAIHDHSPESYQKFKAVIHIPYQTSTMSFFELYRQNIPIFAPSLGLLVDWHQRYKILSGRIYGHPARDLDLIEEYSRLPKEYLNKIPDPNANMDILSNRYWFAFSDFYVMKHVTLFDSWSHLLELLSDSSSKRVNFTDISLRMAAQNIEDKLDISRKWDKVFAELVPHRNRTKFTSHLKYKPVF